ncbi:hypothetical protein ACFY04_33210 [Streptomyces sp. NPDC001549]|uniref:hypothetical protein n=1 Tax=Streptomyces sp. NPDC001549 TaxID=3364586 RepID=UPI0036BA81B0
MIDRLVELEDPSRETKLRDLLFRPRRHRRQAPPAVHVVALSAGLPQHLVDDDLIQLPVQLLDRRGRTVAPGLMPDCVQDHLLLVRDIEQLVGGVPVGVDQMDPFQFLRLDTRWKETGEVASEGVQETGERQRVRGAPGGEDLAMGIHQGLEPLRGFPVAGGEGRDSTGGRLHHPLPGLLVSHVPCWHVMSHGRTLKAATDNAADQAVSSPSGVVNSTWG